YISMDQLQQRQAELLGQRQTLQGLERERTSLRQQLTERRNELAGLSARQANQLAETRRQLSAVEQDLAESEAKRTLLVTAPESGIATAVLAEAGQTVDSSRPLLSIVPADTPLQAELYAPSKSIGFIRPGDAVLIRYQAYPYQKFGQYHGKVQSISRASVSYAELSSMVGGVPGLGQDGEQLYRLRVTLDDQAVTAYGQPRPLQSGMLLDADILQDTRRLYEWVLEPLYSLTGKL
ncbi:TPA: HlyD family secretion protein, partial [Pseudomonas aeruginosa]